MHVYLVHSLSLVWILTVGSSRGLTDSPADSSRGLTVPNLVSSAMIPEDQLHFHQSELNKRMKNRCYMNIGEFMFRFNEPSVLPSCAYIYLGDCYKCT